MVTDRKQPKHRAFIRKLPCARCGVTETVCAHVRMTAWEDTIVPEGECGGTGLKPADNWSVPLCFHCHARQHRQGEPSFWEAAGINPLALAAALWRNTGKLNAARAIVMRARMGVTI